jgi:hypothetical protein
MTALDQDIGGGHDPSVGGGDDGAVVAGTEQCRRTVLEPGDYPGDEPELPGLGDAHLSGLSFLMRPAVARILTVVFTFGLRRRRNGVGAWYRHTS